MTRQRVWTFSDEVYGAEIMIIVGGSQKRAVEKFSKWTGEKIDVPENAEAFVETALEVSFVLIYLPRPPLSPDDASTLVHEVFHASSDILDRCDVEYVQGGANEARAYHQGWIAKEILTRIFKQRSK